VLAGTRTLRNVLTLGLLAAGAQCASADKLDKDTCKQLQNELAYVLAAGAREDMNEGPEWAKANLTRERLQRIKKLIEIEEQLEFRCGVSHGRVAAVKPRQRPQVPEAPVPKPELADDTTTTNTTNTTHSAAPATAAIPAKTEASAKSAVSTPGKITKDEAELVKERDALDDDEVKKDAHTLRGGTNTASPAPKKAAAPVPPAATKPEPAPSRPATKNAYVSPSEVNPFFVTGYGKPR
jgi:hypothetical protein